MERTSRREMAMAMPFLSSDRVTASTVSQMLLHPL
jgi:hypothetical protein